LGNRPAKVITPSDASPMKLITLPWYRSLREW
jgi:hypothetical protein